MAHCMSGTKFQVLLSWNFSFLSFSFSSYFFPLILLSSFFKISSLLFPLFSCFLLTAPAIFSFLKSRILSFPKNIEIGLLSSTNFLKLPKVFAIKKQGLATYIQLKWKEGGFYSNDKWNSIEDEWEIAIRQRKKFTSLVQRGKQNSIQHFDSTGFFLLHIEVHFLEMEALVFLQYCVPIVRTSGQEWFK